ncbi:WD40 repeat-like protein [Suillus brevipes Sb2]|nr:WD40 repeat-like protein [Suillus brevipes Sb2]
MSQLIPSTTPLRTFKDHNNTVWAVAVLPDRRRMVTGSYDKTLRIWDLETGVVLKKMEGHSRAVRALAVSRDGQMIASGDSGGEIIAWHGETGESLIQPIKANSSYINSVDFSPDGTVLATFWCTKTWQMQGDPINCGASVYCVRYSPSGELLAIATYDNTQIYNPGARERVASFNRATSLAWTLDGTWHQRIDDRGDQYDPMAIREWDPLTWQQVGHPWEDHTSRTTIWAIAIDPTSTLVASVSDEKHVRLWRLSDQKTIAIFKHSASPIYTVTFSVDGSHILSGGYDSEISQWEILPITTARHACITGDLPTAEDLLTQDIHTDANNYTSYAHRSFVMARKHNWDHALEDAIEASYISKGIALCGKGLVREARAAFDVASMFTNQDSNTNHFLLLIKAIALFNAAQHEEAMFLVNELAAACPNADILGCRVVEAYLRVQLGIDAFDSARHDEAADHFTAAVNSSAFSSKFKLKIHILYEDLVVLFGWDLEALWLTAHQKRCQAFLSAGKSHEALEAHSYMMDAIDESVKASCLDWSHEFIERCNALAAQDDRILGAEIPGQDQGGYDTEPNFFHGMHQHSQNSRPRHQQRYRRLKRLRLTLMRTPHPAPPPVPPTAPPPVTTTTTFKTHLRHLFTWPSHHATPPVVDVPFAQGLQRNAAGGPKDTDDDLIRDEDYPGPPSPDPNVDPGEHGRCCC